MAYVLESPGQKKYGCRYPGCNNGYYVRAPKSHVNKHFYTFPRNPLYNQLWRSICKVDSSVNTKSWLLCEDHFNESDFVNQSRRKLNLHVVPIELPGSSGGEQDKFDLVQDHDYCRSEEINLEIVDPDQSKPESDPIVNEPSTNAAPEAPNFEEDKLKLLRTLARISHRVVSMTHAWELDVVNKCISPIEPTLATLYNSGSTK